MIYGTGWPSSDYVNGPSGLIRTPGIGTSVKLWGAYSGAVGGSVDMIDATIVVQDTLPKPINKFYRYCCVDRINIPIKLEIQERWSPITELATGMLPESSSLVLSIRLPLEPGLRKPSIFRVLS
jgi:hypothetical protein